MKRYLLAGLFLLSPSVARATLLGGWSGNPGINLSGYRKPSLVWIDTNTIDLEAQSSDGVANKTCIIFPDGNQRCDTEATSASVHAYRRFIGGQTAQFGVGMNGGINPGEVLQSSATYAFYAVRSTATANTTDFTIVASTLSPVQANYAALNTAFTSNGWSYIGSMYFWDNCANPGFPKFTQSGQTTILRNSCVAGIGGAPGVLLSSSTSATNITWTYASGNLSTTNSGQIPANFKLAKYHGQTPVLVGSQSFYIRDSTTGADLFRVSSGTGNQGQADLDVWYIAGDSMQVATGDARAITLRLTGWVDNALTGGGNPLY